MTIKEQMKDAIYKMAWHYDPEAVCYIEQQDNQGYKIQEIDGDYCERCAKEKAARLDKEYGGSLYHKVYEETMPESDSFSYCSECGCLLNASMIISVSCSVEEELDYIVDELHNVKQWDDITGELAWKIKQFFDGFELADDYFHRQMTYVTRRLSNLYKKSDLYKE